MSDMDAYREVFLAESADFLQQITDGLLALERDVADLGPVEAVFRGAHSLKGMAAAMSYDRTANLMHKMEGLMDLVRKERLAPDTGLVSLMLAAVDMARDLIEDESRGRGDVDPVDMIAEIEALVLRAGDAEAAPFSVARGSLEVDGPERQLVRLTVILDEECALKSARAYMVMKRLGDLGKVVETTPSLIDIEDERFDRTFEVLVETYADADKVVAAAAGVSEVSAVSYSLEQGAKSPLQSNDQPGTPHGDSTSVQHAPRISGSRTVRVAVAHLDNLVDLAGELVILKSRLERLADSSGDPELLETVDELRRISADVQYEVMQARMVPVGNIFNRFPRMVRDLSVELDKRVRFDMAGLDIELDRTVLDEIGDPLVHLLRNSVDHGLEKPEERLGMGKPASGHIRLEASRERDHVAILVSDDGRGMDVEGVWQRAVSMGLVRADERGDYTESDILLLTCIPGFTTAETATRVSGRGVGMDVVKGRIEQLGGTIEIHSEEGRGTTFVLRLPLTLAIIQALLVRSREQMFALPLSSVDEVLTADEVAVDTVEGAPVVLYRDGSVLPLHGLDELFFDGPGRQGLPEAGSKIVIVRSGGDVKALRVDGIAGRREIVVKPLSRLFDDTTGFSGATILGDGRVLLIIDPRTVFHVQELQR